jgi:uncharacterized protein (DUF4415 family)
VLVHRYDQIDDAGVWRVIEDDLPFLRTRVASLLTEFGEAPSVVVAVATTIWLACRPIRSYLQSDRQPWRRNMARVSGKQPARSKAKPGKAAAKRQADWTSLKVDWPQPKQAISLRIDQDILAWFRDRGPGYQTRMNAVLRAFVDVQQGKR